MTGLIAHVVHLYPRWVLCTGNDALSCISRQPLGLCLIVFAMALICLKDFKTFKFTSVVLWLVRHSIWLLKKQGSRRGRVGMASLTDTLQAQLH